MVCLCNSPHSLAGDPTASSAASLLDTSTMVKPHATTASLHAHFLTNQQYPPGLADVSSSTCFLQMQHWARASHQPARLLLCCQACCAEHCLLHMHHCVPAECCLQTNCQPVWALARQRQPRMQREDFGHHFQMAAYCSDDFACCLGHPQRQQTLPERWSHWMGKQEGLTQRQPSHPQHCLKQCWGAVPEQRGLTLTRASEPPQLSSAWMSALLPNHQSLPNCCRCVTDGPTIGTDHIDVRQSLSVHEGKILRVCSNLT